MNKELAARLEPPLVYLIALHSLVVGLFLLLATEWGAHFGGWPVVAPLFFARQAGAFHFVVAGGYTLEYLRYRGVSLLLLTKGIAVVFLFAMPFFERVPWVVPLSGVGDAAMGLAVLLVHRSRSGR